MCKNRDDNIHNLDGYRIEQTNEIKDLNKSCERFENTPSKEIILEKKLKNANEVIEEMNEKLLNAENLNVFLPAEILNLRMEIDHIQRDIGEKEQQLDDIFKENEFIKEELKKAKEPPIEELDDHEKVEMVSLSEELGNEFQLDIFFECTFCGKAFATKDHLKSHVRLEHEDKCKKLMKDKLNRLETQISLQKLHLNENLLELNVKESNEKEKCKCKGKCNIIHAIYNWRRKYGKELHTKFLEVKKPGLKKDDEALILKTFSCNPWDLNFISDSQLRKHTGTSH